MSHKKAHRDRDMDRDRCAFLYCIFLAKLVCYIVEEITDEVLNE